MNSSFTDSSANAVCSRRGSPPTRLLHLVLTMLPTDGIEPPAATPVTSSVQNGALSSAQVMNTALLNVKTTVCATSTLRWPSRSALVAITGPNTAYPIEPTAATVPASP